MSVMKVIMYDPIWQVALLSSAMGSHEELYTPSSLPFTYSQHYNKRVTTL